MAILQKNDMDGYTVPTHGLYPFQWSWDSAITALGWMRMDERRAWREVETMFQGQWDNGMIPHILFHGNPESYFPGPEIWGSHQTIPSSAISQPPIWATVVRIMVENAGDRMLANEKLANLLPKLLAYHRWWYRERDPEETGLVCSYHPWESGMDNSPAWDEPLGNVPPVDWPYQRRDLHHVESDQRPGKDEYDRYLFLVDFYRKCDFDSDYIYRNCPYKVLDIGIISILHRASSDLMALCNSVSKKNEADELRTRLRTTQVAIESLWHEEKSCFVSRDLLTGKQLDEVTSATMLPLFAGLPGTEQANRMGSLLSDWTEKTAYALSSTHPDSPRFEAKRYWRGPVWLHINWMIADGLLEYDMPELAGQIRDASSRCIQHAGLWEYFDAEEGTGCGGENFSWTAAIGLHWLDERDQKPSDSQAMSIHNVP